MPSFIDRALNSIYRIGRYYAWWVVVVMALIAAGCTYYILDIPMRSSFLALLPRNDPLIQEYTDNQDVLSQTNYVAVLLRVEPSAYASDPSIQAAWTEVSEREARLAENPEMSAAEQSRLELLRDDLYAFRERLLIDAADEISAAFAKEPEFTEVTYTLSMSLDIPDQYLFLFTLSPERLASIGGSVDLAREAVEGQYVVQVPPGVDDLAGAYVLVRDSIVGLLDTDFSSAGVASELALARSMLAEFALLNDATLTVLDSVDRFPDVTVAVSSLSEIFTPTVEGVSHEAVAMLSDDASHLLMTLKPRYPSAHGTEYCDLVTELSQTTLDGFDLESRGLSYGLTGNYVYNSSTIAVIYDDMFLTTIISAVGVLAIFFIAFGSVYYSIIAVIPLLLSVLLTMAWAKLAMGGFNMVTTFLPALVLGMGIDYGIHMIARYAEERGKGKSLNHALRAAVIQKGKASLIAATTTALVFVGLLTAKSRALFEMGAISAVGIMAAFLVTIFLLPALITLSNYLFHSRHRLGTASRAFRLQPAFRLITGKARAVTAIVIVATFFVLFQAVRTEFEFTSTDLVPMESSQMVAAELAAEFGSSTNMTLGIGFTFYAETEQQLAEIVDALAGQELVLAVSSARDLLPVNLTDQQQLLKELDIPEFVSQLGLIDRSLESRDEAIALSEELIAQFSLVQLVTGIGGYPRIAEDTRHVQEQLFDVRRGLSEMNIGAVRSDIADLRSALVMLDENLEQLRDLPPVETLLRDILMGVPEQIRSSYMVADGRFVVQARVSEEAYNAENLSAFNDLAESISDDYFGMPLVAAKLEAYMKRDFTVSTLLALFLIVITLWRSTRNVRHALLAASPLVLGYIWMLGGMRMLDINFSFLSIMISPLLIGVGVDNGIHILHRYLEERENSPDGAIERAAAMTAVPIIVTSLTTILVFASLTFARTPGLRELGSTAILGLGFCLLFSLTFMIAALRVWADKRV
ncbi:MMPL family transporter [Candidatus Bipolaricaulota bacterium]|nr:MMPL family transporter [Candidatus Bipolaricaulota bacterium]